MPVFPPPVIRRPDCSVCIAHGECVIGGLPAGDRPAYQALVHERPFQKGEVLLREGEIASTFRVVKLGMTLLLRRGHDARQRPVALFGAGQVLGKFGLVGQPNALTCVAASSGRLCEVAFEDFERNGLWNDRFQHQLALAYVRSYGRLADWAQVMRVGGVQGRLAAALLLLASMQRSLLVRLPSQRVLSQLLGARRETIARALRALEQARAVKRRDRWHCELVEPLLAARLRLD